MPILSDNSKTGLSLDFDRASTCEHNCSYCYVKGVELRSPNYRKKVIENGKMAKWQNEKMVKELNEELTGKHEKGKLLAPLRIYGGGDFQPEHMVIFEKIAFPCYIISKNLTKEKNFKYINQLTNINNVTKIILSYDVETLHRERPTIKSNKILYCFTGEVEQHKQFVENKYTFDIYFNIRKTAKAKNLAAKIPTACPCDAGCIGHALACLGCKRCWELVGEV